MFTPVYWPDFDRAALEAAIEEYRRRERRFGGLAAKTDRIVPDPQPARRHRDTRSNLALRIISSAVLAPVAIGIAWLGGWPFVMFWTIAACIVLWEWSRLVSGSTGTRTLGAFLAWMVAGFAYASVLLLAPIILRRDPAFGLAAILFLFAVVWATDIVAYFVGRAIGGPKLWPAVSPKKTWSGAIGGTLGGVAAGLLVVKVTGLVVAPMLVLVALVLSVVSQAGDLLESGDQAALRCEGREPAHSRPWRPDGSARWVFDSGRRRRHGGTCSWRARRGRPRPSRLVI